MKFGQMQYSDTVLVLHYAMMFPHSKVNFSLSNTIIACNIFVRCKLDIIFVDRYIIAFIDAMYVLRVLSGVCKQNGHLYQVVCSFNIVYDMGIG